MVAWRRDGVRVTTASLNDSTTTRRRMALHKAYQRGILLPNGCLLSAPTLLPAMT